MIQVVSINKQFAHSIPFLPCMLCFYHGHIMNDQCVSAFFVMKSTAPYFEYPLQCTFDHQ